MPAHNRNVSDTEAEFDEVASWLKSLQDEIVVLRAEIAALRADIAALLADMTVVSAITRGEVATLKAKADVA